MNQFFRRIAAALLALTLGLSMAACSKKQQAAEPTPEPNTDGETAAAEISPDAVAARVGGSDTYVVTREDMQEGYDMMVYQYTYFGMAAPTEDADVESLQDMVMDTLLSEQILLYQAGEMGIVLNEEEQAKLEADTEEEINSLFERFKEQAVEEGAADPDARAVEIFNEQLVQAQLDMDMEGYRSYVHSYLEKEALKTALENRVGSNVMVTDEEVKDYYDSLLESQQGLYGEEGESDYISDEESYERYGGDPVLIVPEGYVRVRTITVSPDSEKGLPEEYEANKTKLDDKAREYGALSMEDPTKNAAGLKEIKAEYTELKAATDAMFEAYIAEAKAKAEEALQKIEGGMSFEEALLTYGEDSMYTDFPGFVETGILMLKNADSEKQEYPDIARAAANLEPGQHTGIVQVGDVFYIVQYVGEEPAGIKEFDAVREEIAEAVRTGKADTAWAEQEAEWVKDKSLVTYYEDAYRDIGKKKG